MLEAMALKLLMDVAQATIKNGVATSRPAAVTEISSTASFADLSNSILKCYHRTARYRSADIVETPWARQSQYGADKSALIRISYFGITGKQYEMYVGLVGHEQQIRTSIQFDSARVPANSRCSLEQWTNAS